MYFDNLADIVGALNTMLDHSKVVDQHFVLSADETKPDMYFLRVGIIGADGIKYPPVIKIGTRCIIFSDALAARPDVLGSAYIIQYKHEYSNDQFIHRYQATELGKMINEISEFLLNDQLPVTPV